MHLLDQRILGTAILLLLGILVAIKQRTTGSIMRDKPKGNLWIWLIHIFNMLFLLAANPVAAILLITRRLEVVDPTHLAIDAPRLLMGLELGGMALYVMGYLLMAWALLTLKGNYQVGGSAPRVADQMVTDGPYRLVRHPMYTAALLISLGLAFLIQSLAYFVVFCIYLVLIVLLIPVEEDGLGQAYGKQYTSYQQRVKKLIPFSY